MSDKYKRYEIDPEQYEPASIGRFGANLWNNANDLSSVVLDAIGIGTGEEVDKRRSMAMDYFNHQMSPNRYYIPEDQLQEYRDASTQTAMDFLPLVGGAVGKEAQVLASVEPKILAYIKKVSPEQRQAILDKYGVKPFSENMKSVYKDKLASNVAKKKALDDYAGRMTDVLERKVPLTRMGEQPHPDQEKYAQLLQWWKDNVK